MAYLRGTNWNNGYEYENMDHPLNRKSTYNPKDLENVPEIALREAYRDAFCRRMDRIWGEDWSKI